MYPNDQWGQQQPQQQGWGQPAPQPQPGWGPPPAPAQQGWGGQPTQQQPAPAAPPAPAGPPPSADELMAGGHKAAKFEQIGQVIGGAIVEEPKVEQQRDFDTRQLLFWDDGNPRWQVVVAVQAMQPSGDDDGIRAFYLKAQMKSAVMDALRRAGAPKLLVGGILHIRWASSEPNSRGRGHDKKIYEAKYEAPAGGQTAPPPAHAPASTVPAAPMSQVTANLPPAAQQQMPGGFESVPPF